MQPITIIMFFFRTLKLMLVSIEIKLIVTEIDVVELLVEQRTNNKNWKIS